MAIKIKDTENINFPQHTSILKDTFLYSKGSNSIDMWDYKDRKGLYPHKRIRKYILRFWEKHIGDDYNECRNVLIKNIKEKFNYNGSFDVFNYSTLNLVNTESIRIDFFAVDYNGKVCKVYEHKHRYRPLTIGEQEIVGYTVDMKKFSKKELDIIYKTIGSKIYYRMQDEVISPSEYDKIKNFLNCAFWWQKAKVNIEPNSFAVVRVNEITLERGSKKYKRYRGEQKDAYKKVIRENNKAREEKLKTYIKEIYEEEKKKESLENLNKIKKHGFDPNTSFQGDSYHGQKRKKKN